MADLDLLVLQANKYMKKIIASAGCADYVYTFKCADDVHASNRGEHNLRMYLDELFNHDSLGGIGLVMFYSDIIAFRLYNKRLWKVSYIRDDDSFLFLKPITQPVIEAHPRHYDCITTYPNFGCWSECDVLKNEDKRQAVLSLAFQSVINFNHKDKTFKINLIKNISSLKLDNETIVYYACDKTSLAHFEEAM